MIVVIALAAAATLASAPTRLAGFAVADTDYPPFARRYAHEGIVGFTVRIDAAGVPHDCVVSLSSTFAELDARTCEIVEARMRFAPAQNAGQHVAAVYSGRIRWKLDGTARPPFGDGALIERRSVTPDGTIADCTVERSGSLASSQRSTCDPGWDKALRYILKAPLTQFSTVTIVNDLRASTEAPTTISLNYGPRQFEGTIRFVVTTAGRAEQCQIERPSAIARSVDVCAMIFPAQADGQPQFSPGMAQNGSLSLSIYALPRPDAIAPSAGLVRP